MNKKVFTTFMSMIGLTVGLGLLSSNAYGAIIVDGEGLPSSIKSKVISGMTYVPLEPISQVIGANVEFKGSSIYLIKNEKTQKEIEITLGSKEYKLKEMTRIAPGEPIVEDKEIMVPLATLVELLGGEVYWDSASNNVIVTSNKPIKFNDDYFRTQVRNLVKKTSGEIYKCDVDYITALSLSGKNIKDIEGIQYFKSLSYVDLTSNGIKSISPLRNLNNLDTVLLKNNNVTDYSPLIKTYNKLAQRDFSIEYEFKDPVLKDIVMNKAAAFKTGDEVTLGDIMKITELDLSGKNINDLQGMQSLVGLKKLVLSDNKVSNIEPLGNLAELEELTLASNQVENIAPLEGLKKLKVLDLYGNKVSKIDSITKLTSLTQLGLYGNALTDITGVGELNNLNMLVLSNNNITKIDEIKKLKNLKELYVLGGNKIGDYSPIDDIRKNLTFVDVPEKIVFADENVDKIVRKSIGKTSGTISVAELYDLKKLSLNSKSISDLDGIQYITNLEELDLSDNYIKDISPLRRLGKLKSLNLSVNEITDIAPLDKLKNIEELNISHNNISAIGAVKGLKKLKTLRLGSNPIDSYYPVESYYANLDNKDFKCDFIKIMIDDKPISFDSAPVEDGGRVLAQAVPIMKALNMSYEYNSGAKTLTAVSRDTKVVFQLDSSEVIVNGTPKRMKTEAKVFYDRMYIPVTFIAELIAADINWDPNSKIVKITSN